jgi:hypothetical protein
MPRTCVHILTTNCRDLLDNGFTGTINPIGMFPLLTGLRLSKNHFSGTLDFTHFPGLAKLDVSNNDFTGAVDLDNMPALTDALVNDNGFSGPVALNSTKTPELRFMRFDNCQFNSGASIAGYFPSLEELRMDFNELTGTMYLEGADFPALRTL